jgi:glycosyltransferase involved in cell wall biosynthesis
MISIVITTYNRPNALQAVIEGCFRQTDKDFEIIVADDGSGDATRECVAALRARSPVPLQHIWQPDEGFRAAMARNRGILAARGDYILMLDGDCIPLPNYIEQHRKLARPGFMVTGSRVLLSAYATARVLAGNLDIPTAGLAELVRMRLRRDINKLPQLLLTLPDLGREKRRFSYRRIKSCNMGAWRADLERVNGFDESFWGWGHEDSDLVVRLFNAGVMRKDGAFATEVLHLWHREAQRDQESSNRRMVVERKASGATQAERGLREHTTAAAPFTGCRN